MIKKVKVKIYNKHLVVYNKEFKNCKQLDSNGKFLFDERYELHKTGKISTVFDRNKNLTQIYNTTEVEISEITVLE